jgi:hypothetical protein
VQAVPWHPHGHAARNPDTVDRDSFRWRHSAAVVRNGVVQPHGLVDDGFEQRELAEIAVGELAGDGQSEDGLGLCKEFLLVRLVLGEVIEGVGEDDGDSVSVTSVLVPVFFFFFFLFSFSVSSDTAGQTHVAPTSIRPASEYRMFRSKKATGFSV